MPKAKPATAELRASERQVLDSLRILVREIRSSSALTEQATGLSAAQLFVLRVLAREPGLGVGELAARTLTHQSSVSVVVAKLAAAGLVHRRRAPGDARKALLQPTRMGSALAQRSPDPIQERLVAGLDRLPAATRRRLATDLAGWIAAMGIDPTAPEMFFEGRRRG